ncbi:MAG: Arm DNA-binding domain-containing protein, partial [Rhizobacter sp.]
MGKRVRRRGEPGGLTDLEVKRKTEPGYYGDGGGLWLQVSPSGTKSWVFRFTLAGRPREMGLGPLHTVTLAEARDKALEQRKLVLAKVDPIEARRATTQAVAVQQA